MFSLKIKSDRGYALTQEAAHCGLNDLDAARAALGPHIMEAWRPEESSDPEIGISEAQARKHSYPFADCGKRTITVPADFLNSGGRSADEWEAYGSRIAQVRPRPVAETILRQWREAGYPERWGYPADADE